MIFSGIIRRRRDGALERAELENLTAWAEREWPTLWELQFDLTSLQETLDMFLIEARDHAATIPALERVETAVLARAALLGVTRAKTHPVPELEAALGVPMPKD